jgi:hypothetical protein
MGNTYEKYENGHYGYDRELDNGIRLEIWPSEPDGPYQVQVTLDIPQPRRWQRWRSDSPLPQRKRQDIIEALDIASAWLCNKGNYSPRCMVLQVRFTESDKP